jgi:hypothetical protein
MYAVWRTRWFRGTNPYLGGKLGFLYRNRGVVEAPEENGTGGSIVNQSEIARKFDFWHRKRHLIRLAASSEAR